MEEKTNKKGTENVVFKLHKERAKLRCTGPTVPLENGNATYLLTIFVLQIFKCMKDYLYVFRPFKTQMD